MYGRKLVSVLVLVAMLFVMCAGVVNAEKPSYNGAEHGNGRPPSHANAGGRGDKWNNDPDDDGRGPDRGDGSVDDWDWNNGCGNDPDRDDDNEGWCGRPKPVRPEEPTETRKREAKTCNLVLWGETPEVFDATIDVRNPTNEQFVIAEANGYLKLTLPWGFRGKVLWFDEELGHGGSHVTSFICGVEELTFFEPTWPVSQFE